MTIDFSRLGQSNALDRVDHPRELFTALRKVNARYQYARDVQAEVWDQWYSRRTERDLVVKMNTGGGKTVVGLLVLKALANSGVRPAVYIAPDPYLVQQVQAEASALGISTTDDPRDPRFLQGHSILIANIFKLVNGRSVFGVGADGVQIPIGAVVVDDAHACMAAAEEQFTVQLDSTTQAYKELLALFREDLRAQSPTTLLDVEAEDPTKSLLVPFWAWHAKSDRVASVLHANRTVEPMKFKFPLIQEVLPLCQCVFGGGVVEITPHCLPIDMIPSFARAERRVFMTATLADDSVLVRDFDAEPAATERPITPSRANDVGDRLILVPQALNPDIDDDAVRGFANDLASDYNVVVIVPSHQRANLWRPFAQQTLAADDLPAGVARLKAGHVGLTVIINKYDGIDLPDDACRVLIIDGLPDVRSKAERIEHAALQGSPEHVAAVMQRIEQGMGRGIRSNADRCVVLLTGRTLIRHLYSAGSVERMTAATRAQYELSQEVASELRGRDIKDLRAVIDQVLAPDPEWVRASRGALVDVKYDAPQRVSSIALAQRAAFNAARRNDFRGAASEYQTVVNTAASAPMAGWLRFRLATYTQFYDNLEAQRVLARGIQDSPYLPTRPLAGLDYRRMTSVEMTQGAAAVKFLAETYDTGNKMLIGVYALTADLAFNPDTSRTFESALSQLAFHLGFRGQRPETEYGYGPDVLWSLGNLQYLVIEAKNGAITKTINKSDINQLTGSMQWFASKYDDTCSAFPVMIHPASIAERAATPHGDMRVVCEGELVALVAAIRAFSQALAGQWPPTPKSAGEQLRMNKLEAAHFVERYTVPCRSQR